MTMIHTQPKYKRLNNGLKNEEKEEKFNKTQLQ